MAEAGQKLDGLDAFLHTVEMSLSKNLTEVTSSTGLESIVSQ